MIRAKYYFGKTIQENYFENVKIFFKTILKIENRIVFYLFKTVEYFENTIVNITACDGAS
jgi:hypothetical protein